MPRSTTRRPDSHINNRIATAYRPGIQLEELEALVFPPLVYPNAWILNPANGKPACRVALLAALRRLRYTVTLTHDLRRVVA